MNKKDNKTNNGMQKGERRQRINQNQNNVGNPKNKNEYQNFDGDSIK